MDIEVLDLAFKLIHDCGDLLEIHIRQGFVQSLGHLAHVFGHLMTQMPDYILCYSGNAKSSCSSHRSISKQKECCNVVVRKQMLYDPECRA